VVSPPFEDHPLYLLRGSAIMPRREFHYSDAKSDKFWAIEMTGDSFSVNTRAALELLVVATVAQEL
jgi:hypothetical protein